MHKELSEVQTPLPEYKSLNGQSQLLDEDGRPTDIVHFPDDVQRQLIAQTRQLVPGAGFSLLQEVMDVPEFHMYFDRQGGISPTDAEDILIESNRGLVVSIVNRYVNRGVEWDALMAAGNEGLLIGLRRFNPEYGVHVSTYVSQWIRQRVALEVIRERSIGIPANKYHAVPKVQDLLRKGIPFDEIMRDRKLCTKLRLLSADQWDELKNCSMQRTESLRRQAEKKWRSLVSLTEPIDSLDTPLSSGSFGDTIPDPTIPYTEEIVERVTFEDFSRACEEVLKPREMFIIKMVLQGMGKTQIGKRLKITRERVRQILDRDIKPKILRTPVLRRYFETYLASAVVELDQAHSEDL